MADKLAKTYKVNISFVDGETPTAAKLNAWSLQINNALTIIEKALGDVWDESYPYFDTSDTLSQPFEQVDGDDITDEKKLEIANLARLIGPSSALNPLHLSGLTASERSVTENLGSGRTQWSLKYAPLDVATVTFNESPVVTFATRVASLSSLLNAGEYYVSSSDGEIYAVTPTTTAVEVTYTVEDSYDAYASYVGASFNVIPAPDQSTKCTATGPDGEGKYTITLPTITDQDTEDTRVQTTLTNRSLNYSAQLKLPQVLNHLTAGDLIPDGFLFIRDDTSNQLYRSGVYYYENTTSLKVSGVTLDTSHGFTVITVGANLTQSVQDLQLKLFRLRRGQDTRAAISLSSLSGKAGTYNADISGAEPYSLSEAPNNHFPQYLNRDGWFGSAYDDTNINDGNGMRGDLVMLAVTRSGGSRHHLTTDSRRIRFGHATNGPSIFYDSGQDTLTYGQSSTNGGHWFTGKILNSGTGAEIESSGNIRSHNFVVGEEGVYLGETTLLAGGFLAGPFKMAYETGNVNIDGSGQGSVDLSDFDTKTILMAFVLLRDPIGAVNWRPLTGSAGNSSYTWHISPGADLLEFFCGSDYYGLTIPYRVTILYID